MATSLCILRFRRELTTFAQKSIPKTFLFKFPKVFYYEKIKNVDVRRYPRLRRKCVHIVFVERRHPRPTT